MVIPHIEQYPLSQRVKLILAFVDNAKFCKGTTLENGKTTGQYSDFTEGTDIKFSVGETRVFSDDCNIITVHDGTCCANCRNFKLLGSRAQRKRLARDSIHPHTSKRYSISPRVKLCSSLPKKGKHDKMQRKGSNTGEINLIYSPWKWRRKNLS